MKPYDSRVNIGPTPRALFISGDNHYKFVSKFITSGSVLDVGCGFKGLIPYLPIDISYKGIDVTEWVAAHSDVNCVDVMDYQGGPFDYVVAMGVLETCDDLTAMADRLKSLAIKEVIFSFIVASDNSVFKAHSLEEIENAFGVCDVIVSDGGDVYFARYVCNAG